MRTTSRGVVTAGAVCIAALVLVAPSGAATAPDAALTGDITVSAAASLTEAFRQIGVQFERRHPGTDVTFNFDASSALVLQIQNGAPVDVFASADEANMAELVDGGEVAAEPVVFATNRLEIATKPGNPERITTLADLTDAGTIALCASSVPCGKYAKAALATAGVTIASDSITRGLDAKATLTAVSAGDADAAIVYITDVEAAGSSVEGVRIPEEENQVATYPIAPVADASSPRAARAFVRFVVSGTGVKILRKQGFRAP